MQEHRNRVADFYGALADMDIRRFWSCQSQDVIYNISGHTPISGRVAGRAAMEANILPAVFEGLDLERFRFTRRWSVVCESEHRIVAVMEADGTAKNGVRYDQRYVHIFDFAEGLIVEVWEFFDTALAEAALFAPPFDRQPRAEAPFRLP
ncbi:MAG: nuclear transport factor 2 family protein [Algiphilus sp.]